MCGENCCFNIRCVALGARQAVGPCRHRTVHSQVENLFERLAFGPQNTSCGSTTIARQCIRLLDQPLLVTDPDGVSVSSRLDRDLFNPDNDTGAPNFVFTGTASAKALPGSLHASVDIQIGGKGGRTATTPPGLSGYGYAAIEDQIKVRSATLADGSAVTLSTVLNISGEGPGTLFLSVRGKRDGVFNANVFGGTNNASGTPRRLEDIGDSFTAFVGETLSVEYVLRASNGASTALWAAIDVLNGRAAQSSYGSSAFLYFSSVNPAENVFIEGVSGYNYLLPVPEPATALLTLLDLGVVGLGVRRRSRAPWNSAATEAFGARAGGH